MHSANIFTIQKKLAAQSAVSIPWIQNEYGLSYSEAKAFLRRLAYRGWVKDEADGISYPIIKENLKLRAIRRDEVDKLIDVITPNCHSALACIGKNGAANMRLIELNVSGIDDDAEIEIKTLLENDLIYEYGGKYYSCVSKKVISVLGEMTRRTRLMIRSRTIHDEESREELKRLFDPLFDEDE